MSVCPRFEHVIIGNSAAGVAAVEAIRAAGDTGHIAMIGEEPYAAYARHLISYYLTGERTVESMRFRPASFFQQHGVTEMLGQRVDAVDWDRHTVLLNSGDALTYDNLLLAVGARPVVPPLSGKDLDHVFTFTSLTAAESLRKSLPALGSVVVIGGGLIGLQVAEALVNLGKSVTVVELQQRLLTPVLDQIASEMVAARVRTRGVDLRLGVGAQALLPAQDHPERVGAVRLATGETLNTDSVILAIGVAPRLELTKDSPIQTDRAILVDQFMSTTMPSVYAAGDVAAGAELTTGTRRAVPVWPNAMRQGHIAGLAMARSRQPDTGSLMMNAAHFFGLPVVSAGLHDPAPDSGCATVAAESVEHGFYRKLVLRNNQVVGMVATGAAVNQSGIIYGLIRSGSPIDMSTARRLAERCDLLALPAALRTERMAGRIAGHAEKPFKAVI